MADDQGKTLSDVNNISMGDPVHIYVKNGIIHGVVTNKESVERQLEEL